MVESALFQVMSEGRRGVQEQKGGINSIYMPENQHRDENPISSQTDDNRAEPYGGRDIREQITMMPMPEHQHQEYSTNLDMALSRYGYGYPAVTPSVALTRNEMNQTVTTNSSRALAAAAHANMSFSHLTSRPYQPHPRNRRLDQWANNIYNQSSRPGAEDMMLMQLHRLSQLNSFGIYGGGAPGYEIHNNKSLSQITSSSPIHLQLDGAFASASLQLQEARAASSAQICSSTQPQHRHSPQNVNGYPTSLAVPSDVAFLEPVHIFLRTNCIKVFVATQDHLVCPGRGARASHVGQIGLCCAWCKDMPRQKMTRQAVCYPSKRDTIFESVRNYQRVHLDSCPFIPDDAKAQYKRLLAIGVSHRKSQRFMKAYYAEAATDLGLVDSPKGLALGARPNRSGIPSERVMSIIRAAESPASSSAFWKGYTSCNDKSLELRKFEHLASESTREVIRNARKEASAFVFPHDFPTVSDFEFLLFKQVGPCKSRAITLERKGVVPKDFGALSGLCCRHCAPIYKGKSPHKSMWFPPNLESLIDSSFSQSVLNHMMTCPDVPQATKCAFDELKRLASEHCVTKKRGSKKRFLEKIWGRMKNHYA